MNIKAWNLAPMKVKESIIYASAKTKSKNLLKLFQFDSKNDSLKNPNSFLCANILIQ